VKFRFPILAKLLAGLLMNLLLLALCFWLVFRAQFGGSSNEIFASIAGPRVQVMAERLSADLRDQSQAEWDQVLASYASALRLKFALFDGEFEQVAGSAMELPEVFQKELRNEFAPHQLDREGNPERRRPPPRRLEDEFFGDPFPPRDGPPHAPPGKGGPTPMDPNMTSYPKVTAKTSDPTAYWIGMKVPAIDSARGWLPQILVIRSESLTGGGLFFDPKPWLYAGAGVLLISGLLWVPVAFSLTRSLLRIRTATSRIAEGDFAVSVPDANRGDELGELGRSVNQMAQRLEGYVTGQKRFLGDVAHELCSPIARMQASVGILQQVKADEKQTRYHDKLAKELQHMGALVGTLLSFSKSRLHREMTQQPLALKPLVEQAIALEISDGYEIKENIPPDLMVLGDQEALLRSIANVLRNALRYAGEAGPITVNSQVHGDEVQLRVLDQGPGVPDEALPKLFDTFYRPDASRNRDSGGVGLGLAIVKNSIEACGGRVSAKNRPHGGLEVTMTMSAAAH
jgi:two-component system, OmpR family, sensor histidine kinase CpxA